MVEHVEWIQRALIAVQSKPHFRINNQSEFIQYFMALVSGPERLVNIPTLLCFDSKGYKSSDSLPSMLCTFSILLFMLFKRKLFEIREEKFSISFSAFVDLVQFFNKYLNWFLKNFNAKVVSCSKFYKRNSIEKFSIKVLKVGSPSSESKMSHIGNL